jgi:hypothetical protein
MALDQIAIKSRNRLLLAATLALLLLNLRDFLPLSHSFNRVAVIVGEVLFCVMLWKLLQAYGQRPAEPAAPHSNARTTATFAITGTTLLLLSRFLPLTPPLHGFCNVAGWLLLIACWSLPKSQWQALAIAGFYVIALSDVHWKSFASFGVVFSRNIYATIALAILWLAVSALTYFFLFRDKPAPPTPGLN